VRHTGVVDERTGEDRGLRPNKISQVVSGVSPRRRKRKKRFLLTVDKRPKGRDRLGTKSYYYTKYSIGLAGGKEKGANDP